MPMHSMEAGPSHGATEGALGGSGERKEGSSILPAQSPQGRRLLESFFKKWCGKVCKPKAGVLCVQVCKGKLAVSQVLSLNE